MADTSTPNQKHDRDHQPGRSIVARYQSPAEAREAVGALHKAHYTHTWLGVTSIATAQGGDETVTVESGGGFFSHTNSLVDALVSHGVSGDKAREVERGLEPGDALVTVDPKDRDVLEAISLLEQHGGRVAGHSIEADNDQWLPPSQPRTSTATAIDSTADYATEDTFYRRSEASRLV